jgi:hypothetical protein
MIGPFEPIAVYDIRDCWWMKEPGDHERLQEWAHSYGVDTTDTRRMEIYLIDGPSLRVYDVARNEHGDMYRDGPSVALREPYDVLLRDLPPGCPQRPSVCAPGALERLREEA